MKKLILLLVLVGCSQGTVKKSPDVSDTTPVPQVVIPTWGTPDYKAEGLPESYGLAIKYIKQYAVSPEFVNFVISKRTKFSHTEGSVVENMAKYTLLMGSRVVIPIEMYWNPVSAAIGGWNAKQGKILENSKFSFSPTRRAGHLLHETSHVLGWKHEGNYPDKNDNMNSFPYALGYDFEEFLALKTGAAIASE